MVAQIIMISQDVGVSEFLGRRKENNQNMEERSQMCHFSNSHSHCGSTREDFLDGHETAFLSSSKVSCHPVRISSRSLQCQKCLTLVPSISTKPLKCLICAKKVKRYRVLGILFGEVVKVSRTLPLWALKQVLG